MTNAYERVTEFHQVFDHPIHDEGGLANRELVSLRVRLIFEEFWELLGACGINPSRFFSRDEIRFDRTPDLVEVADALGDLEYVINGFAIVLGIDLPAVGEEIHRSNMSKLGENGEPIYREDGKVMKGPNYFPPDLKKVLNGNGDS